MKTIKKYVLIIVSLALFSCGSAVKFPISSVTPAADISAKKKTDSNNNFVLEIIARNLASADRLNPPGKVYSVWVVNKQNEVMNVGQMDIKNAQKSTFKTATPFDFDEVFITVEDQGDLKYPAGMEIARTKIK